VKVQLVQPTTGEYRSNSRSGCYPPLGLTSIATFLRQECQGLEIEIIDGEFASHEEIVRRLDAEIIGINANTVTYPQAVEIAREAKARGAHVVMGGVYITAVPELVERHRADIVDTLAIGYGERAMLEVVRRRTRGRLVHHSPELDVLPYPDRSLVALEHYVERFQANHPTWPYRGTNLFTNVGCHWRDRSGGGCIFCSRSGMRTTAFRDPLAVWVEVRELAERYGVEYVVDFSDTTLQDLDWLRALVDARPVGWRGPVWHLFARMDEITPESLELIERLPCHHIFVGIESGDPTVYRMARKGGGSPEEALAVAQLMRSRGIELTPSYVVGLPGETEESLATTYEHACRLQEISRFEEIFCCEIIPFPGSIAFTKLRGRVSIEDDILDIEVLKRAWAALFCRTDFETMQGTVERILSLGKYPITISKATAAHAHSLPTVSQARRFPQPVQAREIFTCA
jgi:anaerobic magnesium-protoporphyrin IX monomethyl ester cyclase